MSEQRHTPERNVLDTMADFVSVELDLAKTFCDLARSYQNEERSGRALGRAWIALESALSYMWKLRMEHNLFDEMTARAERLRLELEAFGRK